MSVRCEPARPGAAASRYVIRPPGRPCCPGDLAGREPGLAHG